MTPQELADKVDALSDKDKSKVLRCLYWKYGSAHRATWMGVRAQKIVTDAWIYQELICSISPDIIIETGTAFGGSSLFLADMCDLVKHGHVYTIDKEDRARRDHSRITKIIENSANPKVLVNIPTEGKSVMVILDSEHTQEHVTKELNLYGPLVTKGSYLIIEDCYISGVYAAIELFLKENPTFVRDMECEKFILTYNPGGYLRKK